MIPNIKEIEDFERFDIDDSEIFGSDFDSTRKFWRKKFENYTKDLGHPLVSAYISPLPHIVGGLEPSGMQTTTIMPNYNRTQFESFTCNCKI